MVAHDVPVAFERSRVRTEDQQIKSLLLYQTELTVRKKGNLDDRGFSKLNVLK